MNRLEEDRDICDCVCGCTTNADAVETVSSAKEIACLMNFMVSDLFCLSVLYVIL